MPIIQHAVTVSYQRQTTTHGSVSFVYLSANAHDVADVSTSICLHHRLRSATPVQTDLHGVLHWTREYKKLTYQCEVINLKPLSCVWFLSASFYESVLMLTRSNVCLYNQMINRNNSETVWDRGLKLLHIGKSWTGYRLVSLSTHSNHPFWAFTP